MDRTPFLMSRRAAMGTIALLPAALPLSAAIAPPPPTLGGIEAAVLAASALPATQSSMLIQVLKSVQAKVRQGNIAQAVALLRSFIAYVAKFAAAGSLTAPEAANLTGQANGVIGLLNGLSTGLQGYWKLDEGAGLTTADASGNGVTGTLQNGAGWAPAGVGGKALALNGASQYVDLGTPAFPAGFAARSMCGWAKPANVSPGFRWIFAYGTPALSSAMFIGMNGTFLFGGGYGDDLFVDPLWDTNWHHVALTYDGATAILYFDGVQVASGAKNWPLIPFRAHLGRQVNNAAEFWQGLIDEVRMYDRVLTPAEVAALSGNA